MKQKTPISVCVLLIATTVLLIQSCTKANENEAMPYNPIEKSLKNEDRRSKSSKDISRFARGKRAPLTVKEVNQKIETSIKNGIPFFNRQGLKLVKGVINEKIDINSFLLSPVSEHSFVLVSDDIGKDKKIEAKDFNSFIVTKVSNSPLS